MTSPSSALAARRPAARSGTVDRMATDRYDDDSLLDPPPIPEALAEKVHDLIDGKRVLISASFSDRGSGVAGIKAYVYAYVIGDHEPYVVRADREAVRCSCWAARMGNDCAHRYAAMAAWAEQARPT
jgi:hypothetical protein